MKRIKFQARRQLREGSFHELSEELKVSKQIGVVKMKPKACVHHLMDVVVDYSPDFSFKWHSTRFVGSKRT